MKLTKLSAIGLTCILTLFVFVIYSCKKANTIKSITMSEDATVVYKGDIAADGCGWQIITAINDSTYKPQNLPAAYEVNNLAVHIVYHKLATRFSCSDIANSTGPGITEIQLDSIKNK